jgi:hypothetical protein
MKAKRYKRIARDAAQTAFRDNVRASFTAFCRLAWRERLRIAWLLVRGDDNLEKAVRQ